MSEANILVDAARLIVALSGAWLIFAGLVALLRPAAAIRFIASMGSTPRIHWIEHLLRGLAGIALMLAANVARFPAAFFYCGAFVAASSVLILLVPRAWHARYARTAAAKLHPFLTRLLAPISIAAGAGLIWAT